MYTLKPSLQINCSQCHQKLTVNFCPPLQHYSNKNHWGYWTKQKKNDGKYICDTCLIDLYRNHKQTYLDSITDSKKRRTFRAYFGGKTALLTKTQQKQIKIRGLHDLLKKRNWSRWWRQTRRPVRKLTPNPVKNGCRKCSASQKKKGQIKPWINWGIGEVVMEKCLGDE